MSIIYAFSAFTISVLLHGISMRITTQIDSVKRFLIVGLLVGFALVAYALNYYGLKLDGLAVILLYALMCELYIFFFTLVLSSVSATMLILLRDKNIKKFNLQTNYSPEGMVQLRVSRLIKTNFLKQKGNLLYLTKKGHDFNFYFKKLHQFFRH